MARAARKDQNQGININLMPQEEIGGTLGETIHWVLTIGRYLIIGTEIVALATFGLSLKLTIDKNNLNKSIENAQQSIDDKAGFEVEFREIQAKLNNISDLRNRHFKSYLAIEEFNNLLPEGIKLTDLSLSQTEISFSGSFPTAAQLHTLINSFNSSGKLVSLEIDELNSPSIEDPQFTFSAKTLVVGAAFTGNSEVANPPTDSETSSIDVEKNSTQENPTTQ